MQKSGYIILNTLFRKLISKKFFGKFRARSPLSAGSLVFDIRLRS